VQQPGVSPVDLEELDKSHFDICRIEINFYLANRFIGWKNAGRKRAAPPPSRVNCDKKLSAVEAVTAAMEWHTVARLFDQVSEPPGKIEPGQSGVFAGQIDGFVRFADKQTRV
jgi:hypothetical protein